MSIKLSESPLERAKRLHRWLVDVDTLVGLEREPRRDPNTGKERLHRFEGERG